jgi:hypothetical protein
MQQTNWSSSVSVPRFDPALGALQRIDITLSSSIVGSIQVESLDANPTAPSIDFLANVTLTRPDISVITVLVPLAHYQFTLAAFDGTIDFSGPSGVSVMPTASVTNTSTSPPPLADLLLFSGASGNPGTIQLPLTAINNTYLFGSGNIAYTSTMQADATVQVCYTFVPAVPSGTDYCFGDGSSGACPCANVGAAGHGCASSINPSGAVLHAIGNASVSADSLELQADGMPNSAALYYQGTTQIDTSFGDGKRCAGGTVIRLGTKINAAGASQYPVGTDPRVSVKGMVLAGSVRDYQVWYRNAAMFCTPSTFNLTNGSKVTWIP